MKILVTGAAGFIGSHVARAFAGWGHEVHGLDHRPTTIPGVTPHVADLSTDMPLTEPVDVVFNLASHSHVDHSIVQPRSFILNNITIAITMLEYARAFPPGLFVQFSTDEVYGPAPAGTAHGEWSPIIPSNPYAASKAAQEAIAIAYWRTYGVPVVLTQTMNVYGPGQLASKFVPMAASRIRVGAPVPIHAERTPEGWVAGSRHWLYVDDVASALRHVIRLRAVPFGEASRPARWNIVGEREIANDDLALMIGEVVGERVVLEYTDFHAARPGHDRRYALDGSDLAAAGWTPRIPIREGLERTLL